MKCKCKSYKEICKTALVFLCLGIKLDLGLVFRVSSSVRVELGLQLAYLREFWDDM